MDSILLYLIIIIEAIFIIKISKFFVEKIFYYFYSILLILTFVIRPLIISYYDVMMYFFDLKEGVDNVVLLYTIYFNAVLISLLLVHSRNYINYTKYLYKQENFKINSILLFLVIILSLINILIAYYNGPGLVTTLVSSSLLLFLLNYWLFSDDKTIFKVIILSFGLISASINGRTFPVLMLILILTTLKISLNLSRAIKYLLLISIIIIITVTLDQNRFILQGQDFNFPDLFNFVGMLVNATYAFSFYDAMLSLFSLNFTPTFGADFFRTALVLFPRAFFPDKPAIYGTELEFTDLITNYDASTFIPSFVGISYFWFGYAGIIFGPVILVIGVAIIARFTKILRLNNARDLIFVLVSFKIFRSGFDWIFLYSFFVILPIVLSDRFIWNYCITNRNKV